MKKIIALSIAALLALMALAGCAPSDQNSDETAPMDQVSATEPAEETTGAETDTTEKVSFTLSMHVANVEEQEPAIYGIVQAYMEKNPNVEINLTGEETNEHYTKMKMDAQAGTLPDVFFNLLAPSKEMAESGYLYCLDDFIAENNLADIMDENMVNSLSVDGKVYGLPYQALTTGFWYNQALFDEI